MENMLLKTPPKLKKIVWRYSGIANGPRRTLCAWTLSLKKKEREKKKRKNFFKD
jgi:hypothetical protein